jgi:hypothetical protein
MEVNPDSVVVIALSGAAKALRPVVFKEGKDFCVLLGTNPQDGVFGCGVRPSRPWRTGKII